MQLVAFLVGLVSLQFLSSEAILNRSTTSQQFDQCTEEEKDFVIRLRGLFTIYNRHLGLTNQSCDKTKVIGASVQLQEMASYTVNVINADPHILPGIKLILESQADCRLDTTALELVMEDIFHLRNSSKSESRNNTYWGVIGPETSEIAIPSAKLLGLFHLPQISFSSTASELSDKRRFPYFFRTIPSDIHQIKAIVTLLERNNWNYVIFMHEDNDYGNSAYKAFIEEIANTTICLARQIQIHRDDKKTNLKQYFDDIKADARAKVIITFVVESRLRFLFELISKHNMMQDFQFIGSDIWSLLSNNFSHYTPATSKSSEVKEVIPNVLDGAMYISGYIPKNALIKGFEKFIRGKSAKEAQKGQTPFIYHYLAFVKGCELKSNSTKLCPDNLTLPSDMELTSALPSAAVAVQAFATALDNIRKTFCDEKLHVSHCDKFHKITGSELRQFLQNVSIPYESPHSLYFDKHQDGPPLYTIWRYNKSIGGHWKDIGYFAGKEYRLHPGLPSSLIQGRGSIISTCSDECLSTEYKKFRKDKKCCWDCSECEVNSVISSTTRLVLMHNQNSSCYKCGEFEYANSSKCLKIPDKYLSFEDPLAWCVASFSGFGILLTFLTTVAYVFSWNTPVIKASGRELSLVVLFSLAVMFSACLLFCFKPTTLLCILRRVMPGICFALIYSSLLVKTVRISFIFNTLGKRLIRSYKAFLKPKPQIIIALCLTSVQSLVIGVWLTQFKTEVTRKTNTTNDKDARNQFTVIYLDCNKCKSLDSLFGLAYPMVLLLLCTVYALKIRKVPVGFNEARHIGFVVYTTLVIWLAQIPTYLVLTSSNLVFRDGVYCLGLCLNGLIIILALFGPKLYIVLCRSEKNNQEMVMSMSASRSYSITSQSESFPRLESVPVSNKVLKRSCHDIATLEKDCLKINPEFKCCPRCGLKLSSSEIEAASSTRRKSLPVFSPKEDKMNDSIDKCSLVPHNNLREHHPCTVSKQVGDCTNSSNNYFAAE